MKIVQIGFKSGRTIEVQCESVEVEWYGNTVRHMQLHGEQPEIAFLNTDHVEYVLVEETRNLRRSRRQDIKGAAADTLQSAT